MTDTTQATRPAPEMLEMMRRRGMTERSLTVAEARDLTPRMRRVSLTLEGAEPFEPKAGQDLVMMLPDGAGGLGRRHYTIRSFDPATRRLDVDFVLHSDATPGARFALNAKAGDKVLAFGPRGRNVIQPGADWRLFVGDETAIPPILAMIEALPAGAKAHAIIEVADDADRQTVASAADVTVDWISRGGSAGQPMSQALIERLAAYQLPAGQGHAYVLGETSTIRRQRHDLLARGLSKEQIFGEGYWRPGRLGGHDHLVEH
jgi:NADPH-dependent ferric siderophore reductase